MISFYMDEHVPKAITNGLRLQNIDVLTVQEDGRTGIPDDLVLERAIELTPDQWNKAVASNPSFAFLHDAEENIYTLANGVAVSH